MSRWAGLIATWVIAGTVGCLRVLDWPHLVLLAGCVSAVLLVGPNQATNPPRLPDLPPHSHPGARRDLSALSWAAIDREGMVSQALVARAHALTKDDPSLEDVRRCIESARSASPAQVLSWLDQVARLTPTRQG